MNRRQYVIDLIANVVGGSKRVQTAELIIERLEEEGVLHLGYGDAEIDQILDAFKRAFGTTKTTKFDRFAAGRLAKKYGSQTICGIIGLLANAQTERYAPVTNSVVQLEEKLPSILNFLRNLRGSEEIINV